MVLPPMVQPFDLQYLFVNTFAGSLTIFSFIAVFMIAAMAAKFRMPALVTGMVIFIFAVIMGLWLQDLLIITTVVAAFVMGSIIGRIVKT